MRPLKTQQSMWSIYGTINETSISIDSNVVEEIEKEKDSTIRALTDSRDGLIEAEIIFSIMARRAGVELRRTQPSSSRPSEEF